MSDSFNFESNSILAGRYRILRLIARGGMGEVYEVEDLHLQEIVALKTLKSHLAQDEVALARFQGEVKSARRISHPNVCRVFEFGVHGDGEKKFSFLTMELLSGETLDEKMKRRKLSHSEILDIMTQVAAGLDAAHGMGVVHRDLKPSNIILVSYSGGGLRAVIADFGIARRTDSTTVTQDGWVGTPAYISPEQLEGKKVTHLADIYSMGIMLYEMVTGVLPFQGTNGVEVALQRLSKAAPRVSLLETTLPNHWDESIATCLKRTPEERWFTATDAMVSMGAIGVKTTGSRPRSKRWYKRYLLVVATLLIAVVTATVLSRRSPLPAENRVVSVMAQMAEGENAFEMPEGFPAFNEAVSYVVSKEFTRLESARRFRVVRDDSGNTQVKISWKLVGDDVVAQVNMGTKEKLLHKFEFRAANMQLLARKMFPEVAQAFGEGQVSRELWPEEEEEAKIMNAPSAQAYKDFIEPYNFYNLTNGNDQVEKKQKFADLVERYPRWAHPAVAIVLATADNNEIKNFAEQRLKVVDRQLDPAGVSMLTFLAEGGTRPANDEMLRDRVATAVGQKGRTPDEWVELTRRFGKIWPDDFWSFVGIFDLRSKGDALAAKAELKTWLKRAPGQPEAWLSFEGLMPSKDLRRSAVDILFEPDVPMKISLAYIWLHNDELDRAERISMQLMSGGPRVRATSLYLQSVSAIMRGQLHLAAERLSRGWALAEQDKTVDFLWTQVARESGQIAETLGNIDEAVKWKQRAIQVFERYEWPASVSTTMRYEVDSAKGKCRPLELYAATIKDGDRAEANRFLTRAAYLRKCASCESVAKVGRSGENECLRPWQHAIFECANDSNEVDVALSLAREHSKLNLTPMTNTYDGSVLDAMLARYWTAKLFEKKGDKVEAKKAYELFLNLWRAPDFKSDEWTDAKARLAALSQ